jgi:hypothetical protein
MAKAVIYLRSTENVKEKIYIGSVKDCEAV